MYHWLPLTLRQVSWQVLFLMLEEANATIIGADSQIAVRFLFCIHIYPGVFPGINLPKRGKGKKSESYRRCSCFSGMGT